MSKRMLSLVAKMIFSRTLSVNYKKVLSSVKRSQKTIWKARETFSQDSISALMQIYLRFCQLVLTLMQFKTILKSYSMLLTESYSMTKTEDLLQTFNKQLDPSKKIFPLLMVLKPKVTLKTGFVNLRRKCKDQLGQFVKEVLLIASACH